MDSINSLSILILGLINTLLSVETVPIEKKNWIITSKWHKCGQYYCFKAKNKDIIDLCKKNPGYEINIPRVIHSFSKISNEKGSIKFLFNHEQFKFTSSFFGAPLVSCDLFKENESVVWELKSYTKYFARFSHMPKLVKSNSISTFFNETLCIGAGIILILMTFFSIFFYHGKDYYNKNQTYLLSLSCFFTSLYFIFSIPSSFGISVSMFAAHKTADFFLWIGLGCFWGVLWVEKVITTKQYTAIISSYTLANITILLATSGDGIQLGTTIGFPGTLVLSSIAISHVYRNRKFIKLQTLGLSSFLISCINDILVVTGILDVYPILPIGIVGCYSFLLISTNENINETYLQRDKLKKIKKELEEKNIHLEKAKKEIEKKTVAILHKSRLESIGTLASGVAHELNNPLTGTYSLIKPLLKRTSSIEDNDKTKSRIIELLHKMESWIKICLDITDKLKQYSGINRAARESIKLYEVAKEASDIVMSNPNYKHSDITIDENIMSINLFQNRSSISQIFSNLIKNSIESGFKSNQKISIKISLFKLSEVLYEDDGPGIPVEIRDKIFSPFFTTKSDGTGLGLYLIKQDLENMGYELKLLERSEGTAFLLIFHKL